MHCFFKVKSLSVAITAAEVSILAVSEDAPVAGQLYTLLCTVTVQNGPISHLQIMWLDPAGQPLSSQGVITIAKQPVLNPTRLTTYSLSFSPLHTSHGGEYTCQATVTSPQQTLQETSSAAHNLTVDSKEYFVNVELFVIVNYSMLK